LNSITFFSYLFYRVCSPHLSSLFPYTTLFRSVLLLDGIGRIDVELGELRPDRRDRSAGVSCADLGGELAVLVLLVHLNDPYLPVDRKSTRLNSSHVSISYAVFCLKRKNMNTYV